jgi:hypothetical protein
MDKLTGAKAVIEEAYICLSEGYDYKNPLVINAGRKLFEILKRVGDYYNTQRFARVCYDGLICPLLILIALKQLKLLED